jgi:glutathione S-transferase
MRLFYSPFHKFIHKALVVAHEVGLWDQLQFVPTYPFNNLKGEPQGDKYSIAAINPLGKVPTLALDDGTVIYGSQAVVEYFDSNSQNGQRLYPEPGPARWDNLTRLALGDTIFEVAVTISMEGGLPEEDQRLKTYQWIWPKLTRAFDTLELRTAQGFDSFDIGQVAALQGISYLDYRSGVQADPVQPDYDWKVGRPHLTAWWNAMLERPSVVNHYLKDYEGDDSAEFLQANVSEVLALQANR